MTLLLLLTTPIPLHDIIESGDEADPVLSLGEETGAQHPANRLLKKGVAANAQAVATALESKVGALDIVADLRKNYILQVHNLDCDFLKASYFQGLIQNGVAFIEQIPAFAPKKVKSSKDAEVEVPFYSTWIRGLMATFFTENKTIEYLNNFVSEKIKAERAAGAGNKACVGLPDQVTDLLTFLQYGKAESTSERGIYSVAADARDGLAQIEIPNLPGVYGKPGEKAAVNICLTNSVWRHVPVKKDKKAEAPAATATEAPAATEAAPE